MTVLNHLHLDRIGIIRLRLADACGHCVPFIKREIGFKIVTLKVFRHGLAVHVAILTISTIQPTAYYDTERG
jgi:hypothetical protein